VVITFFFTLLPFCALVSSRFRFFCSFSFKLSLFCTLFSFRFCFFRALFSLRFVVCTLFSLFLSFFRALFLRSFFFALSRSFFNSGIYRKTATPCLMTSLAHIQDQVPRENYFEGPCFYGQRRLCLALCILSSLYEPAYLFICIFDIVYPFLKRI
jgi:hypothetical protein